MESERGGIVKITDLKKWGHDELANDLADTLIVPERMVWTDMQLGPMHSARPDVFTMNKSYTRPFPTSYEIKVSLSDFRSDITSGKWQRYLDFSTAVIFAVPKGLINKDDLPSKCGLMVRSDNGWRTVKKPTRETVSLPERMMLKLLIDGIERERRPKPEVWNQYAANKIIKKKFGENVAKALSDLSAVEYRKTILEDEISACKSKAESRAAIIIEDAKAFREKEQSLIGEVCRALGMEVTRSSVWAIRNQVQKIKEMSDENQVITQALKGLVEAKNSIERSMYTIKPIKEREVV